MKQNIGMFALVALCAGCASETGSYTADVDTVNYNAETFEVTPRFKVEVPLPIIADQGNRAILGKWRVRINTDSVGVYLVQSQRRAFCSSRWEIDEYEFKDDGTYSMRRLSKDGTTVLSGSGQDGRWTYADGILRLRTVCNLVPGPYTFCAPRRFELGERGNWRDYRVKWHPDRTFTVEHADLDKMKNECAANKKTVNTALGIENSEEPYCVMYYDSNGCFHCRTGRFKEGAIGASTETKALAEWYFEGKQGVSSDVTSPLHFKRVGN